MASGDTLYILRPQNYEPATSNSVTPSTRNGHTTLLFSGTVNQSAVFGCILPRHYSGNGITVYLHYAMATATSGDIDWDAAFERVGDQQQDIDSDGFASVQSVDNTTVPGTSGNVDIVSIAFTDGAQIDSIAVGEYFRMQVTRDAVSDADNTVAELIAIELKET